MLEVLFIVGPLLIGGWLAIKRLVLPAFSWIRSVVCWYFHFDWTTWAQNQNQPLTEEDIYAFLISEHFDRRK